MNTQVIGIDLGTTFSLAAQMKDGQPLVIRDSSGNALIPSVISFDPDGSVFVGSEARRRAFQSPEQTIFSVKRLMGRTLSELRSELSRIPYQITEREVEPGRRVLLVRIGEREHTPEELSAMILREVRRLAGNPSKAVITVPAYFDDSQRQATRDAGRIAGLDVLRIVNEPTAAALAYGLHTRSCGTIAVYDLGGGTFDCSILSIQDGVFKVLSTNGDTRLGGDDFDHMIMDVVLREMTIDTLDAALLQLLRHTAERTKIALTNQPSAEFRLDMPERGLAFHRTFTRPEFEKLIEPLVARTLDRCRSALRDAGLKPAEIDEVVLVGGSSRVPYVQEKIRGFFGRLPHTSLNPDEVVALGAAVQADILSGGRRDMLLLDVVPLSLGIETLGGAIDKVIHRNSTVPARATTRYTTFVDNQTGVDINIFQGERELAADCQPLGKFKLRGIPPMPAQMAQIDVTFLVDANGILTVSAKELRSGQTASVTVQPTHGLTQDEVERLVLESVEHAREDFRARRLIELRNKAEADLRHTERALANPLVTVSPTERREIEETVQKVREVLACDDPEVVQQAIAHLGRVTGPLAERLMNAVVQASLAGKKEDSLRSGNIGLLPNKMRANTDSA